MLFVCVAIYRYFRTDCCVGLFGAEKLAKMA